MIYLLTLAFPSTLLKLFSAPENSNTLHGFRPACGAQSVRRRHRPLGGAAAVRKGHRWHPEHRPDRCDDAPGSSSFSSACPFPAVGCRPRWYPPSAEEIVTRFAANDNALGTVVGTPLCVVKSEPSASLNPPPSNETPPFCASPPLLLKKCTRAWPDFQCVAPPLMTGNHRISGLVFPIPGGYCAGYFNDVGVNASAVGCTTGNICQALRVGDTQVCRTASSAPPGLRGTLSS